MIGQQVAVLKLVAVNMVVLCTPRSIWTLMYTLSCT